MFRVSKYNYIFFRKCCLYNRFRTIIGSVVSNLISWFPNESHINLVYEKQAKWHYILAKPCQPSFFYLYVYVCLCKHLCHLGLITIVCLLSFQPLHPTGERPFKCKLCSFASTTQSHLSRHKRVHTGEKPYRCPWCDYRYRLIDQPMVGGADGRHHGTDDQGVDRWG